METLCTGMLGHAMFGIALIGLGSSTLVSDLEMLERAMVGNVGSAGKCWEIRGNAGGAILGSFWESLVWQRLETIGVGDAIGRLGDAWARDGRKHLNRQGMLGDDRRRQETLRFVVFGNGLAFRPY